MSDTRVRTWLWLSYLTMTECDALAYAYPRIKGSEQEIEMLRAASDRFYAKAREVAGGELSEDAWREAVDALGRVS